MSQQSTFCSRLYNTGIRNLFTLHIKNVLPVGIISSRARWTRSQTDFVWKKIKRLVELEYFWGEYLADRFIGDADPGPVFRFLFRAPVHLYAWGLHGLVSTNVLLITTRGRKTGKPRTTPLGYLFEPASNTYYLIAGWKGKTNWYQNALVHPEVRIAVGSLSFDAVASRVDDNRVAEHLALYAQRNPFAVRLYRRLTGIVSDGRHETFLKMAPFYPTMAVHRTGPREESGEVTNQLAQPVGISPSKKDFPARLRL